MKNFTLALFLLNITMVSAQSYTSYFTGDTADVDVQPDFGLCLMGGAGESDEAMTWFLEKANGGDVVVLRASGSDGYNDYMFSELGVSVNSVESIVFNSAAAASDPYVIARVNQAEAIWMAGGDQFDYVSYWQGTAIQDAINNLMNNRSGAVGGISAGMAVLAQGYFSAENGSIMSDTALENPFAPQMTIGYDDFLETPFLEGAITETHFNDPDRIRYGRIVAFMARMAFDQDLGRSKGLASNEYCAIAVGADGLARAFGGFPNFDDDYVYFLQSNCAGPETPETIEAGVPLTWNRGGEAVKVYKVPATTSGLNYFDLNTWETGEGGNWEDWYVVDGELFMDANAEALNCISGVAENKRREATVFPNPASGIIRVQLSQDALRAWRIYDSLGKVALSGNGKATNSTVDVSTLPGGVYKILSFDGEIPIYASFVKLP